MFVVTFILAVVLALAFLGAGAGKLTGQQMLNDTRDHLGVAPGLWKAIGALEVAGAAGLLLGLLEALPVIGVLAAVGLVLLSIGAVYYHQNAGDSFKDWLPIVVLGSLAILYVIFRIGSA